MSKKSPIPFASALSTAAVFSLILSGSASALTLTNGPGDGTVSVGVDAFGSFGSAVGGSGTSNAFFDPVGVGAPAGTTFDSGIAIGFGAGRTFMTSGSIGGSSGGSVTTAISGTTTTATSAFSFGRLAIELTQTLTAIFSGMTQTGSELTQVYKITNMSGSTSAFDVVRYIDGDLLFDGSLTDGGGRLFAGMTEILFEIDSATGTADPTTFIGITGEGGTTPATGRYEIDSFSGLRSRTIAGTDPDDTITGDSGDADEFIDSGAGYDITMVLRSEFSLLDGEMATYTTRTIFGEGAPGAVTDPGGNGSTGIPEPATLALFGLGLAGLRFVRRRRTV